MKKEKYDKPGGGNHFLAGYGWQVLAAPLLAAILLFLFFWFFGYDVNLLRTNVLILAVWLILVLFAFRRRPHGEDWRNYGWIFSPALLVLLLLVNISWARSNQEISALGKSRYVEINVPNSNLILHAVYPQRINYDEQNIATLTLWVANDNPCEQQSISLSSDALFFALEPADNSPLKWQEKITTELPSADETFLIHIQPRLLDLENTKEVGVKLIVNNIEIQEFVPVLLEGSKDAQIRLWKNTFLDASSVSVIIGVVAAWIEFRRKEEEERKRNRDEIESALGDFEQSAQSNFSASLEKWDPMTRNWNKWEHVYQNQFRNKFRTLIENDLWNILSVKGQGETEKDIKLLLQLCERIFENKEEKPVFILKQLHSALRQDADSSLALLAILKEHPASIGITRQIAASFPPELKKKTVNAYAGKFPDQVRNLKVELGIPDTESFPLHRQFAFHAKPHTSESRLTSWLNAHELECSPFADADSPFYSALGDQLLVDLASPGFEFPAFDLQNSTFKFSNSWDAGAALFEYCKVLQTKFKIKEDIFFVAITPSLIENYRTDNLRKLYLHALAEQWTWLLAEAPTMFYSLKGAQRDLVGRLLRWHDASPSVTTYKIAQYTGHIQEGEGKNQTDLLSKITEWLTNKDATDPRVEEMNVLIELRPLSKCKTLFLISAIDLYPHMGISTPSHLYEKLVEQSNWLSAHNCGFIRFLIGDESLHTVTQFSLVNQCKTRVRNCSKNRLDFSQLFDAPGHEPDAILAQKAGGSPGKMVRLGQKLLLQHTAKSSPKDYLHIEDLLDLDL